MDDMRTCRQKRRKSQALALIPAIFLGSATAYALEWQSIGPEGGYFVGAITDSSDANHVIAVEHNRKMSFESTDGGASWTAGGSIAEPYYLYDFSAFDHNRIYTVGYYRCHRTTDAGQSWQSSTFPAGQGYVYTVNAHPTDPAVVYAAGFKIITSTNRSLAFFKSIDGGQSWAASSFFDFPYLYVYDMAVSRSNPDHIYVSGAKAVNGVNCGAMFRSIDGGNSWADISSAVDTNQYHYMYSVAVDPTDHNRVYIGGGYFYRSTNAGVSWTTVRSMNARCVGIDPQNPQNLSVASYSTVYTSTNYGLDWTIRSGAIDGYADTIEVAAATPSTLFVSGKGGLRKSIDAGATWANAHNGINNSVVPALAVAPSMQSRLYVESEEIGVYASDDCGSTWQEKSYFVACGDIGELAVHPEDPDIALALEGAG